MIGESLDEGLRTEGYELTWVRDGQSAMLAVARDHFDLILLDLGLPKRSGLEVLREYRANNGSAQVLIISARDRVADRVQGLDEGADDYLPKPFDFDELCARIRALSRRRGGRHDGLLGHQGVLLDPRTRVVMLHDLSIDLTLSQFEVLRSLMENPGAVVSRSRIEQRLYGIDDQAESNTIDVFIHQLRRKFGAKFIRNVRGFGYSLASETAAESPGAP
jgi:two-component system, OmpR family, response regulator QseB